MGKVNHSHQFSKQALMSILTKLKNVKDDSKSWPHRDVGNVKGPVFSTVSCHLR